METRIWFPLLGFLVLVGLLANLPFLTAVATALLGVLGLASWWRSRVLDGIHYQRRFHYTRAFPGEEVEVRLIAENRKLLPASWLRVVDPWPRAVGPADEADLAPSHIPDRGYLTSLFSLRWFERARRTYALIFRKRGVYSVGPATFESGDVFGIYHTSAQAGKPEHLTVFPALIPLAELNLPAENPLGDHKARRLLFEDPSRPAGVREYRPEDGFRRVHWPATARTGDLQVKVYTPTSAPVTVICLNVSTSPRYWEGIYPDLLERLVSISATLADQLIHQNFRVGLVSNGCLSNSDQSFRISPGGSHHQLAHLLEALAGVTPVTTAPFERFLLREAPRVPYGAMLAVITAFVSPELEETLVQLKRHERRISLISLAADPPGLIPGVHCVHLPFQPDETNRLDHPAFPAAHVNGVLPQQPH